MRYSLELMPITGTSELSTFKPEEWVLPVKYWPPKAVIWAMGVKVKADAGWARVRKVHRTAPARRFIQPVYTILFGYSSGLGAQQTVWCAHRQVAIEDVHCIVIVQDGVHAAQDT